jgi:hypothetical protein
LTESRLTHDRDRRDELLVRGLDLTRGIDEGWLAGELQAELALCRVTTDLNSSLRLMLERIDHEHRSGSRVHLIQGVIEAAIRALPRLNHFDLAIVGGEFMRVAEIAMTFFGTQIRAAETHLSPDRIVELRQQARSMSFSDFADYARSEIEAALAELESA